MKKIILFLAFTSLFFLPAYSQLNTQPQLNNNIEGTSVYQNRDPFYHATDFDFTSFLKDSVFIKKIFIPKIPDNQLFFGRYHVVTPDYNSIPKLNDSNLFLYPAGVFSFLKDELSEPLDKYPLLIAD